MKVGIIILQRNAKNEGIDIHLRQLLEIDFWGV